MIKKLTFAFAIFIILSIYSTTEGQIDYYHFDGKMAEKLMFSALNRIRLENRLPLLHRNDKLQRVADHHARDMLIRDFFDHINPDGETPRERAQSIGIPYPVSENLGILSSYGLTLDEVVEELLRSLMESPEHRANILNPDITEVGIAFAQDKEQNMSIIDMDKIGDSKLGYGTVVVCQNFMKRGLKYVNPDPFPKKIEKGDSITITGETYKEFDTVLIELENRQSKRMMKTSEIALFDKSFEEKLKFIKKGDYDLRISGNQYEDEITVSCEELVTFKLKVE